MIPVSFENRPENLPLNCSGKLVLKLRYLIPPPLFSHKPDPLLILKVRRQRISMPHDSKLRSLKTPVIVQQSNLVLWPSDYDNLARRYAVPYEYGCRPPV